jgi:hypothetical protein
MRLLDFVESQIIANRLPLVAVTVAAVPYANTPVVLSLHWHGFVELQRSDEAATRSLAYEAVPSSALQINERWDHLGELDSAAADVAWELGAWDLARVQAPPFRRPGADSQEALECLSAFGTSVYIVNGDSPFVADVPDLNELLDVAGKEGYLKWQFRPVRGGLWSEVTHDATLEPGGYRNPPCRYRPQPLQAGQRGKVVYRFGRPGAR